MNLIGQAANRSGEIEIDLDDIVQFGRGPSILLLGVRKGLKVEGGVSCGSSPLFMAGKVEILRGVMCSCRDLSPLRFAAGVHTLSGSGESIVLK